MQYLRGIPNLPCYVTLTTLPVSQISNCMQLIELNTLHLEDFYTLSSLNITQNKARTPKLAFIKYIF